MDLAREYRRFKRWTKVWGINHQCPFCKRPLSRFDPAGLDVPVLHELKVIGGGLRNNARCLVCGSMDRERLVYLYLLHHTDLFKKNLKVLHVAPEPLLMRTFRQLNNLYYLTADLKSPRADVKMDLTAMPFQQDTFDIIVVNHVLEHIPEDQKAMREILRILKPGTGRAILQVPISLTLEESLEDPNVTTDQERLQRFGQEDHVRIYGQDYPSKLEKAGFIVEKFDWKSDSVLCHKGKNKYGLIWDEVLFTGFKKSV